jgi:hypothetical protein
MLFGLALLSLAAISGAWADDVQPPANSDGAQKAQKQSSSDHRSAKTRKQVAKARSQPAPAPSSISSAESYAAGHSADLPVSSTANPAQSTSRPWTGVYIGGGVGAGRQ